ncbi:MAG: LysR substrate-binding domain-containing protein [Paracoccus sp. (in: a-proteobacteria)]
MQLPPLAAIRAFESAARHLSFTRAADELGMTQAGVSYQIKLLEERLGQALFLRRPRALELTALGHRLARPTSQAFDILRDAYAEPAGRAATLSITTPLTTGNWLAERLGRFQTEHPDLTLRLDATDRVVDFAREDFDLALRNGKGDWPGVVCHRLFAFDFAPMLSPTLLDGARLDRPEDLLDLPWIESRRASWAMWMEAAGIAAAQCRAHRSPHLGTQIHEARAAIAGQGVAMLTPRFFRHELATGSLIQPFGLTATNGSFYWLVYPEARRNRPAIRAFRRFLLAEVAADEDRRP